MNPNENTRSLRVALLGNPNAGKSSLFNGLTGLNQKTGNYAGVTVEKIEGHVNFEYLQQKWHLQLVDLPGIYSLYPKSADERIACSALFDKGHTPDVIVIVADATNLKRSLLLVTQLTDLKLKTVIALSMFDEAKAQQIVVDIDGLQKTFGVPVVPVDSRHLTGFDQLRQAITQASESNSMFYDQHLLEKSNQVDYRSFINQQLSNPPANAKQLEDSDKLHRAAAINYMMAKFVSTPGQLRRKIITSKIDAITTHKVGGYLVLLLVLFLVFQMIFFISEAPMSWIEAGFGYLGELVANSLPAGKLNDLLVNGVIAGIGGVVMFVPQIAFLFLFIGFLEDSGYMARASFIMDKLMRRFGLNGKSVIPLMSGTACAVPSIMATRSIANTKERLITIFILPLISCSARLPVYTLLLALLYPQQQFLGIFNARGFVLFLLYLLGFVVTLITAYGLKKIIKTKDSSFFVMELPVYRWPQARNIFIMVYTKVKVFITEAGLIIMAISVVLWFLSTHGSNARFNELSVAHTVVQGMPQSPQTQQILKDLEAQKLENSYIGQLGHFIEPVIRPMGFDWKIGIALITSFAAREVFVGTMSTIYKSGSDDDTAGIREKLRNEKRPDGTPLYSTAVSWSLLLFYAFALQCISTIAVVKRETRSWKWVIAQLAFLSTLAYVSASLTYHLLS